MLRALAGRAPWMGNCPCFRRQLPGDVGGGGRLTCQCAACEQRRVTKSGWRAAVKVRWTPARGPGGWEGRVPLSPGRRGLPRAQGVQGQAEGLKARGQGEASWSSQRAYGRDSVLGKESGLHLIGNCQRVLSRQVV